MLQRLAICVFVITLSRTYGQFQLSFGTPTPPPPKGPLVFDPSKFLPSFITVEFHSVRHVPEKI